jgi:hypothetical protein
VVGHNSVPDNLGTNLPELISFGDSAEEGGRKTVVPGPPPVAAECDGRGAGEGSGSATPKAAYDLMELLGTSVEGPFEISQRLLYSPMSSRGQTPPEAQTPPRTTTSSRSAACSSKGSYHIENLVGLVIFTACRGPRVAQNVHFLPCSSFEVSDVMVVLALIVFKGCVKILQQVKLGKGVIFFATKDGLFC